MEILAGLVVLFVVGLLMVGLFNGVYDAVSNLINPRVIVIERKDSCDEDG